MSEFKPGDLVRLKSGGPVMTVGGGVIVAWIDHHSGVAHIAMWDPELLDLIPRDEPSPETQRSHRTSEAP